MYQQQHIIYILQTDAKLAVSGEHLRVIYSNQPEQTVPLRNIKMIISFSYMTISAALMEKCAKRQIGLMVFNKAGRLRFQISGETKGNVCLRMQQYRIADSESQSVEIGRKILSAKISGGIWLLNRFIRNHPDKRERITPVINELRLLEVQLAEAETIEALFGIEGIAAKLYFSVFDSMILREEEAFRFYERNRRPPKDYCNAMLSFAYTLLTAECKYALEGVGLDPYVGFIHGIRPGKPSLALDMMEEFRPILADRFVLRLLNLNMVQNDSFEQTEEDGIYLNEKGRRKFLEEWNRMEYNEANISDIERHIPIRLVIHLRAQQLAQYIREGKAYEPMNWR